MKHENTPNNYSYYQTGFSVRHVRSIFNSLSEDTYFTVQFYKGTPDSGEPTEEISGNKGNAADYIRMRLKSIDMYRIFNNMSMQCNAGFGNSVILTLYNEKI